MTLTNEDLQAITGLLAPIHVQLDRMDQRQDRMEEKQDRMEEKLDQVCERQEKMDGKLDLLFNR